LSDIPRFADAARAGMAVLMAERSSVTQAPSSLSDFDGGVE
jgi:hypothetical protein